MRPLLSRAWRAGRTLLLAAFVVVTGGSAAFLATKTPTAAAPPPDRGEKEREGIRRAGKDGVLVPEAIARNMGLKTAEVSAAVRPIPLPPLQGVLALDTDRLSRVHTRFAGEVAALGTREEAAEPSLSTEPAAAPAPRPVRVGDPVRKGDLLAVVWSKDLGEKKSELVDAASKLRADELTLRRLQGGDKEGFVAERSVRDAERAVESDRVAVERAERTLRSWRLTDAEIAAVRAEADRLRDAGGKKAADPADWARVEVRAPLDGVILEKNVTAGDIVDTSADLFKVGDLSHLMVWAHVYEEDLPLLQGLPKPVRWTVRMPSRPGVEFAGRLESVGAVIDPNQHTALVTGRVENPAGELKVGQFVTATVALPPPAGEVELPADAVVEDGRESVVFVARPGEAGRFDRTPVRVARRFRDSVCVRAGGGVKPGDRVVTGGALLLRDAMDQQPVPQP
jgi:cobalt-zinc-cadmium efflux system membrane fusion protein